MTFANGSSPVVVVTGANGLVGTRVCAALSERGATVRAVVRREGAAPDLADITEEVGNFGDPAFAGRIVAGADAVVTTVHPLGADEETQRRVGLDGNLTIARAAAAAGVARLVHLSTAGVYDRRPGVGDVDELADLVPDDANSYGVVKRDIDAGLADVDGITRILLRPPAVLGPGESSVWNAVRPAEIRDDESARHAVPDATFAWVHVDDLASFAADLALSVVPDADDPEHGPVEGACTPVNVATGRATQPDYVGTVTQALGVEPVWDAGPGWTGAILADRAHRWGWKPRVDLDAALQELASGLRHG